MQEENLNVLNIVVGKLVQTPSEIIEKGEEAYLKKYIEVRGAYETELLLVPIIAKDYIAEHIIREYENGDIIHFIGSSISIPEKRNGIAYLNLGYSVLYIDDSQTLASEIGITINNFLTS